jgi:DNA-binding NarL/FixJ family response regulator
MAAMANSTRDSMNPRHTILIADDHPIFRKGLAELLTGHETFFVVAETADGEAAWNQILSHRPDIAILDIQMPKLSGLRIARRIREEHPAIHVILLTMHNDDQLLNEALDAGVHGFVLKESATSELLDCLRAVLEGKTFISPALTDALLRRRHHAEAIRRERPGLDRLTPSERRVLKLIAQDRTSKEIADALGISHRTVETHRQNICHKLDVRGTHSLLKFAYEHKSAL